MKKIFLLAVFTLFTQSLFAQYCTPTCIAAGYAGAAGSYGQMGEFIFNGYAGYSIDDTMMRTVYSTTEYINETAVVGDTILLQQGGAYSGTINYMEAFGYMGNQIWVDFNDNSVFEASESVTSVFPNTWTGTHAGDGFTANIPLTAATGYHRMRVRNVWYCYTYCEFTAGYHSCYCSASSALDPCNDSDSRVNEYYTGNTVDYTCYINVLCSLTVAATNSGPICYGNTLNLYGSVTSGTATGYSWSGPGGFTSTLLNPTISSATAAGNYIFTASSSSSCSTSVGTTVTVYPALTCTVTGTTSLCSGNSGTFTFSGTSGATVYYKINGGSTISTVLSAGGTSTISTGTLTTGSTPTTYTYSLVSMSDGGGACTAALSGSLVLTVYPMPTAITGTSALCSGITSNFTDGIPGGTWTSSNTGVASINSSSGVLTTITTGTTTISYTAGGGCYAMLSTSVTSSPSPITATITNECPGASTTLTDPSGAGNWVSSNPSIATVGSTSGVVGGVATGSVTITFSQSSGCYATIPFDINPVPTTITGTLSVCEAGSTTTLSDTLGGGTWSSVSPSIASIDPSSGILTGLVTGTAVISYIRMGCFAVTTVTVMPLPPSIISPVGDTMLCPGDVLMLTANTGRRYTYQWNNSGGTISGATHEFYETSTANYYSVTITDANGCVNTSTPMDVTVNPATASDSTTSPTTFCEGGSAMLTANTGTGFSYQWLLSGSGIAGATDNIYYATVSGDYSVVVSNMAGCTATSSSIPLTVLPAPVNVLTLSGPTSFCSGASVVMTADAGYTYQWMVGGTNIAGATNISYTATTAGSYQVTETNSYPCSSTSAAANLTVIALPSAAITATGSTAFCAGGSVGLSVPAGATNYQWYYNSSAITGATNRTYTASTGGYYTAQVVAPTGCANITSPATYVDEVTIPVVDPYTSTNFCWGGSAYLGVNVTAASGVTYQWLYDGSPISGATGAFYNAGATGNYSCIVSIGAACTGTTAPVGVVQYPLPNPIVNYSAPWLITASDYTSYQWYKNSVLIPGATNYRYLPSVTGNYTVKVTDTNTCQSVSSVYDLTELHSGLSVANVGYDDDITIYPNPAQNEVNVVASQELNVVISAMDGRKVLEQNDATKINISSLANGVYMIMLYNKEGQMVKVEKLMKN